MFVNCILGLEKLLSDICEARAHNSGFLAFLFQMYYSHFIPFIGDSLIDSVAIIICFSLYTFLIEQSLLYLMLTISARKH